MKTIVKLFQLKLNNREVKKGKQIMAIVMIPLFVFQMCSINLFLSQVARAADETTTTQSVSEESDSDEGDVAKDDDEDNSSDKKDEISKENEEEVSSVDEEEAETAETADNVDEPAIAESSKDSDLNNASDTTENSDENSAAEPETSEESPVLNSEEASVNEEIPTENVPILDEQSTEGAITPEAASIVVSDETDSAEEASIVKPEWKVSDDGKTAEIGPVEKDMAYKAPQNSDVTVTFTKIPDEPGNLKIEEITLTDEQIIELGALSNKAYDITSDMKDGTFEYDLTLPKPEGAEDVQIKYAENKSDLDEAKTIDDVDVKSDKVEAGDLDHFTIFVVTETEDSSDGSVQVVNVSENNKLTSSDNDRMDSDGRWTITNYSSSRYIEFRFDPDLPGNAVLNSPVKLNFEYRRDALAVLSYAVVYKARLLIENQATSNWDILENDVTIDHPDTDETFQITIPSQYVDTVDEINNLKIRFQTVGRAFLRTDGIKTHHDYVALDFTYDLAAPIVSSVSVAETTLTSATINWTTDHPSTSRVVYDTVSHSSLDAAPNYGYAYSTIEDSTLVTSHSVTVSGLTPGTTYYFRPVSHGSPEGAGEEVSGTTLSDTDGDGIEDSLDNCPSVSNPGQEDSDGDGVGDVCDDQTCRNGIVETGEECDDGNDVNTDSCTNSCTDATCGDGFIFFGVEECDDGAANDSYCIAPYGGSCSYCDLSACTNETVMGAYCGDGNVDSVNGEQCDDANLTNDDSCDNSCQLTCGNGVLDPAETCDDGDTDDGDGCSSTCSTETEYSCTGEPSICTDVTGPAVEITNPAEGFVAGNIEIRGTVTDANPDHYYLVIQNSSGTKVAGPGTVNDTTSFADKLFFTWNTTSVADGNYTIKLEARDAFDNKDTGSVDWHVVTVDNTAPVITINNPNIAPATSKTVTASTNEGTLGMFVNDAGVSTCDGSLAFVAYADLTFSSEADNGKTICYEAEDSVGNIAYELSDLIAGIDANVPAVTNVNVVEKTTWNDYTPYIKGDSAFRVRADVADVGSGLDTTTCEYSLDDGANWTAGSYNSTTNRCIADIAPTVADGTVYEVNMRVADTAGNIGVGTAVIYTVDSATPGTNLITINPDTGTYTSANPTVTGTITDAVSPIVQCQYRYRTSDTGSGAGLWSVWANGTWDGTNCVANPTGLIGGVSYDFSMRGKDTVGHYGGGMMNIITRIIDTTAPAVVSISSDGQIYNLATSSPQTITITFSEDISNIPDVEVHSIGSSYVVNNCGDSDAKTFCFDYPINSGEDLTHTIYVSGAMDLVGNAMTLDTSHTFIVDTILPTVSFVDPTPNDGLITNNNDQTFKVNVGDDTQSCKLYYGSVNSATAQVAWSHSWPEDTRNQWYFTSPNGTVWNFTDRYPNAASWYNGLLSPVTYDMSSAFSGESISGNWILTTYDQAGWDSGGISYIDLVLNGVSYPWSGWAGIWDYNTTQVTIPVSGSGLGMTVLDMTMDYDESQRIAYVDYNDIPDGTSSYYVECTDDADNSGSSESRNITIDTVVPTATVFYSTTDWTNGDVMATISPSEPVTITNNNGLNQYVFTENGSFTFEFVDLAGNTGSVTATVSNIDKTAPIVDAGTDQLVNSQFTQDATVDGSISGVASYAWTQISGPGTATFGTPSAEDTTVSANVDGTYVIRLTVVDNAGNSAYDEFTLIWDTTLPVTTLTIDPATNDGDNGWYVSNPKITLTASDENGIDRIEYQLNSDSGTWTTYTGQVTIDDGVWSFYYRSIDNASNISNVGLKNVKVDTQDPDEVDDPDAEYREDSNSVKLTWDAGDDDINEVYIYRGGSRGFSINSGSRIAKNDDNDEDYTDYDVERGEKYYYKFVSRDEAGNKSDAVIISVEIPEEEGAAAIVTNEGTESVPESTVLGTETSSGSEEGEGGGVLGEEMQSGGVQGESAPWWMNWWLWLLILLAIILGIWLWSRRKNDNGTGGVE